ncbi:6862_t:CDS:10 [Paraglomus brasilianum]|uniref:6862_t:CDS:1 n=1 Tax=Paraglomus brasilianum TaxID=144538 RepID=A0A9N8VUT8_9GLOM|nr:6862_t:CDS:10 [Paraglomus brasilianum]
MSSISIVVDPVDATVISGAAAAESDNSGDDTIQGSPENEEIVYEASKVLGKAYQDKETFYARVTVLENQDERGIIVGVVGCDYKPKKLIKEFIDIGGLGWEYYSDGTVSDGRQEKFKDIPYTKGDVVGFGLGIYDDESLFFIKNSKGYVFSFKFPKIRATCPFYAYVTCNRGSKVKVEFQTYTEPLPYPTFVHTSQIEHMALSSDHKYIALYSTNDTVVSINKIDFMAASKPTLTTLSSFRADENYDILSRFRADKHHIAMGLIHGTDFEGLKKQNWQKDNVTITISKECGGRVHVFIKLDKELMHASVACKQQFVNGQPVPGVPSLAVPSKKALCAEMLSDGETLVWIEERTKQNKNVVHLQSISQFTTKILMYIGKLATVRAAPLQKGVSGNRSEILIYGDGPQIQSIAHLRYTHNGDLVQTFHPVFSNDVVCRQRTMMAFYSPKEDLRIFDIETGILLSKIKFGYDILGSIHFIHGVEHLATVHYNSPNEAFELNYYDPLTGEMLCNPYMESSEFEGKNTELSIMVQTIIGKFYVIEPTGTTITMHLINKDIIPIDFGQAISIESAFNPNDLAFGNKDFSTDRKITVRVDWKFYCIMLNITHGDAEPLEFPIESYVDEFVPKVKFLDQTTFFYMSHFSIQIWEIKGESIEDVELIYIWAVPDKFIKICDVELYDFYLSIHFDDSTKLRKELVYREFSKMTVKHAARFLALDPLNPGHTVSKCYEFLDDKLGKIVLNDVDDNFYTCTMEYVVTCIPKYRSAEWLERIFNNGKYVPRFYLTAYKSSLLSQLISYIQQSENEEDDQMSIVLDHIVAYCVQQARKYPGYMMFVTPLLQEIADIRPSRSQEYAAYLSYICTDKKSRMSYEHHMSTHAIMECIDMSHYERTRFSKISNALLSFFNLSGKTYHGYYDNENCISPLPGISDPVLPPSPIAGYPLGTKEHWDNYTERFYDLTFVQKTSLIGSWIIPSHYSVFINLAVLRHPMLQEPAFEALVKYKWENYGQRYYLILLFAYWTYSAMFIIPASIGDNVLYDTGLKYPVIVMAAFFLLLELRQFLTLRLKYSYNLYNIIELASFILPLVVSLNAHADNPPSSRSLSWVVLLLWVFMALNLRAFEGMGVFIIILYKAVLNLVSFILLMSAILAGFTSAYWILLRNSITIDTSDNNFESFWFSLNSVMAFLGGDFSAISNVEHTTDINLLRILFMVSTTIMLLNILIAILNTAYSDVASQARRIWVLNCAEILAEFELFWMTPEKKKNKVLFPRYIYYEADRRKVKQYRRTKAFKEISDVELEERHVYAYSEVVGSTDTIN